MVEAGFPQPLCRAVGSLWRSRKPTTRRGVSRMASQAGGCPARPYPAQAAEPARMPFPGANSRSNGTGCPSTRSATLESLRSGTTRTCSPEAIFPNPSPRRLNFVWISPRHGSSASLKCIGCRLPVVRHRESQELKGPFERSSTGKLRCLSYGEAAPWGTLGKPVCASMSNKADNPSRSPPKRVPVAMVCHAFQGGDDDRAGAGGREASIAQPIASTINHLLKDGYTVSQYTRGKGYWKEKLGGAD